ncbi:MAG: hypothetical protein HeimC2_02470 [Candidatus Heimdallarchaeota archaeon LC_2]|nr:MAG: hypothetical protein HeimC2_02470 [Candidatus Heimdallarchaeota archaeon LC_2]
MQKITFFNILLISSLLLLFPLIQPNEEISILPDTPLIFQKNIITPKISLELKENHPIFMNISKFDINQNSTALIYDNFEFSGKRTIEFDSSGIYIFKISSSSINTLIIIAESIYPTSIILIIIIGSINVILFYFNMKLEIL